MIIDEDVMELNRLSEILECQGYDICPLHRSYKVLSEISKCHPDLILLDSMLSEMDSMLISRAINTIDTIKDIPLMMISGKDHNNYTYSFKPLEICDSTIKTADIHSLLRDIELKLAC